MVRAVWYQVEMLLFSKKWMRVLCPCGVMRFRSFVAGAVVNVEYELYKVVVVQARLGNNAL